MLDVMRRANDRNGRGKTPQSPRRTCVMGSVSLLISVARFTSQLRPIGFKDANGTAQGFVAQRHVHGSDTAIPRVTAATRSAVVPWLVRSTGAPGADRV